MACNTCNTPASSGGNLPATTKAYLTDPATAPGDSCGGTPLAPCEVPQSRRRYLQDYIPGWLLKLTGAPKGKMLIGVGSVLHYFKGENPGPLYFDGEDVTVGEQPTLTASAKESSVLERGFLTLARKVKRPKVLPNGSVAELEFYEHGVQQLREIGFGEMLGLTVDHASGQVRCDVIQPEVIDLVKRGRPDGFRRFGFATHEVDGGCGKVDVRKFYDYQGEVYSAEEIPVANGGIAAVFVPVKSPSGEDTLVLSKGNGGFVWGTSEKTTEEEVEAEYVESSAIALRWTDSDGDARISYKDPTRGWYHPVEKILELPTKDAFLDVERSTAGVSHDARFFTREEMGIPSNASRVKLYVSSTCAGSNGSTIANSAAFFGNTQWDSNDANPNQTPAINGVIPQAPLQISKPFVANQPTFSTCLNTETGWVPLHDGGLWAWYLASVGTGPAELRLRAHVLGWSR